jgi:hypothetical protein
LSILTGRTDKPNPLLQRLFIAPVVILANLSGSNGLSFGFICKVFVISAHILTRILEIGSKICVPEPVPHTLGGMPADAGGYARRRWKVCPQTLEGMPAAAVGCARRRLTHLAHTVSAAPKPTFLSRAIVSLQIFGQGPCG